MRLHPFERVLREEDYAENSIVTYSYAVRDFLRRFTTLNSAHLLAYKAFLIETYKPKTVNLRIRSMNKYLEVAGRPNLKLKTIKMPKESYTDNVISNDDYVLFKRKLRKDPDQRWYFIVWILAATGVRISELTRLQVEHVKAGYADIRSKGNRIRRVYFPPKLQAQALKWLEDDERNYGPLFLNTHSRALTTRGIAARLRTFAVKYGINPEVVHPHSFRHLFAKNFLRKDQDISLLADLLGHSSIETTRIYLQQSSREQGKLVDEIVDW